MGGAAGGFIFPVQTGGVVVPFHVLGAMFVSG